MGDDSYTRTATYASAIAFNNQGALHLQHGRFLNAAKSFHAALDTIKGAMEDDSSSSTCDNDATPNENIVNFEWSQDPKAHSKLPQEHDESHHDGSFVYRRALVIHSSCPESATTPSENGFMEESSAILYNLALAYHLYGMESRSRYLATGLRFYELAFGLRHSGKQDEICDLFDLALLNNLGQIHYQIFNFEKSLQCFCHLEQELMTKRDQVMQHQDYMGFLLNLTLQAPSAAPSA